MDSEEFTARRRAQFVRVDDELRDSVEKALRQYASGKASWSKDLVDDASVLWLEIFQDESPHADPDKFMARFKESIGESLKQTTKPDGTVDEGQIERVTRWLGTYLVNDATFQAAGARGMKAKRWVTMHDPSVRENHVKADGQIKDIGAPFDVGGYHLRFPGDPVGPPEIWINCRCVVQSAARKGDMNVSTTTYTFSGATEFFDPNSDDIPMDVPEDDEELITEVPVHGVLAPEGVWTGDGRRFAEGALTARALPLPIAYQLLSGDGHSGSATVGRIDEVERVGNEFRFRGALMLNRQYTSEVIEGLLDGTVRGISVDVDDVEVGEMSEEDMAQNRVTFSAARVAGVTIVPIPAFQEAFMALGHEFLSDLPDEAKEALAACGCLDGPEDDEENVSLGYDLFKNYDAAARKRMAENGEAMPDGSFPIANLDDLKNAIQAIGRASDPTAAKAHIRKRAKALGHSELIPESWGAMVVDLTVLSPEQMEEYEALPSDEQDDYAHEHNAVVASGAGTWTVNGPITFTHAIITTDDGVKMTVPMSATVATSANDSLSFHTFAPGTHDGPGWITHPIPTARLRRYWVHGKGALKIRWGVGGDFNRCRRQLAKYVHNPEWLAGMCANLHKEALGFWPATHAKLVRKGLHASAEPAPIFNLVASADYVFDSNLFERPDMETPRVGVIVEDDRVFGYVAQWGVCHIGISGVCTEAPSSPSDYWYYATGLVSTDKGEVRVGQITMDTGHAALRSNAKVAAAHYDNTGSAVADIAVGEDEFGIWFSGALRPSITDAQRHALRASGRLSGDWRQIGHDLELVAALAVNVPGFPIPHVRAGVYNGEQVSLVAAGLVDSPESALSTVIEKDSFSATEVVGLIRSTVAEYRQAEKREARTAPIREALRTKRIESLRSQITKE
jgi:hypothetical protein